MEQVKYDELYADPSVVKYNEMCGMHFKSENEKLLVFFFFTHKGYPGEYTSKPERRIQLVIAPIERFDISMPARPVKNSFIVLANANYPNYAFTYRVTIDQENRSAKVKIEDYPALGGSLIGVAEVEGLIAPVE